MDSDKWEVELTHDADLGLGKLPKDEAKKAVSALRQMEEHPYVSAAKLKYTGSLVIWRRKKGRLRIIFQVNKESKTIRVLALDLRDDETYENVDSANPEFTD